MRDTEHNGFRLGGLWHWRKYHGTGSSADDRRNEDSCIGNQQPWRRLGREIRRRRCDWRWQRHADSDADYSIYHDRDRCLILGGAIYDSPIWPARFFGFYSNISHYTALESCWLAAWTR